MVSTAPTVIRSNLIPQSGSRRASDNHGSPLDLVGLTRLMQLTGGKPEVAIGLIDGPVLISHADFANNNIREIPGTHAGTCRQATSVACTHGTFVAGILLARRGSVAPAICPDCTLLVRPIFAEGASANGQMPSATPEELATAIIDCIDNGAQAINLSAAIAQLSSKAERKLEQALNYCARRAVLVIAAAGNQGTVGSSAITRHPWVIPVIACDLQGRPISYSNLGHSIGRRGLSAPGAGVRSLSTNGDAPMFAGTSAAAPFVTGTAALLLTLFPNATGTMIKLALTAAHESSRSSVVPPLLNAWTAYQMMMRLS